LINIIWRVQKNHIWIWNQVHRQIAVKS
jgi:hypothetical protein